MPLLTGVTMLTLDVASGSIFLLKMERENDVFTMASIERECLQAPLVSNDR